MIGGKFSDRIPMNTKWNIQWISWFVKKFLRRILGFDKTSSKCVIFCAITVNFIQKVFLCLVPLLLFCPDFQKFLNSLLKACVSIFITQKSQEKQVQRTTMNFAISFHASWIFIDITCVFLFCFTGNTLALNQSCTTLENSIFRREKITIATCSTTCFHVVKDF